MKRKPRRINARVFKMGGQWWVRLAGDSLLGAYDSLEEAYETAARLTLLFRDYWLVDPVQAIADRARRPVES